MEVKLNKIDDIYTSEVFDKTDRNKQMIQQTNRAERFSRQIRNLGIG